MRRLPFRRRTDEPQASGPVPIPLTRARIAAYLDSEGYKHVMDDDGDLAATWNGNPFWLIVSGEREEVLQVRGRWATSLPREVRTSLLHVINGWNRDRFWPKAYVRDEGGLLAVYGEWSIDLAHGVTDEQLGRCVLTGLATTLQLFDHVAATLPPSDSPDAD